MENYSAFTENYLSKSHNEIQHRHGQNDYGQHTCVQRQEISTKPLPKYLNRQENSKYESYPTP